MRYAAGVDSLDGRFLELQAPAARAIYVLAHGAGAGMRHPFLEEVAQALASRGITTLRYEFPYMAAGKKRPDPPRVLEAAVREAVAEAQRRHPDLPRIAGGKSLGGRMTSQAAARAALPGVRGLAFLGFPLHPPGAPDDARAAHLEGLDLPMLFLQGTRDAFADPVLLHGVLARLGERASLHRVEDADHGFHVPKRSGRTDTEVVMALAEAVATWTARLTG